MPKQLRDDGSRASFAPLNGRGRVRFSIPRRRAQCRQRNLAVSVRTWMGVSSGKFESQYFVGSFSPSGHSDEGAIPADEARRPLPVSRSWSYPHRGKARGQGFVGALPPPDDAPSLLGKPHRQRLGGNSAHVRRRAERAMAGGPARSRAWAPAAPCQEARRSAVDCTPTT